MPCAAAVFSEEEDEVEDEGVEFCLSGVVCFCLSKSGFPPVSQIRDESCRASRHLPYAC